jgi:hypothetical protein
MRSLINFLFAAAVAASAVGCGGDSYEIAEGPLSGKIDGQSWTFVSGWTDDFLSDEKDLFTALYDIEAEACSFGIPDVDRGILLNVPREPGEYELGLTRNVTLYVGSDNNIATLGRMVVESVTETEVKVGLYAIFGDDENFEVSGEFTAAICPSTSP